MKVLSPSGRRAFMAVAVVSTFLSPHVAGDARNTWTGLPTHIPPHDWETEWCLKEECSGSHMGSSFVQLLAPEFATQYKTGLGQTLNASNGSGSVQSTPPSPLDAISEKFATVTTTTTAITTTTAGNQTASARSRAQDTVSVAAPSAFDLKGLATLTTTTTK